MPEAGTQTSLAHAGSGGADWRGIGPADPETGQRVSNGSLLCPFAFTRIGVRANRVQPMKLGS